MGKRKVVPPWEHVGNEVRRDSPIRCEISYKRPEQIMRCVYAAGHQGAHLYGNLTQSDSAKGVEAREVGHPAPRQVGASQLHDTEISPQSDRDSSGGAEHGN